MRGFRFSGGAVTGAIVTLILAGGVAVAAIPSTRTGKITGCVHKTTRLVRVIDAQSGKRCGRDETAVDWNAKGVPGTRGATGLTGPAGTAGPAGTPGSPGAPGAPGTDGAAGAPGAAGAAGAQGPQGAAGVNGVDGDPGAAGPSGAIGPQGPSGPTGPTGPAGSTGPAGPTGSTGPAGPSGPATDGSIVVVGNGVTDDAPAIQTALTAARVAGGGTVRIPFAGSGVARLNSRLVIGSNTVLDVHPAMRLQLATGTNGNLMVNYGHDPASGLPRDVNIHIVGGQWDRQNNSTTAGVGYTANTLRLSRVDRVSVKSAAFYSTLGKYSVNFADITDFTAENLHFPAVYSDGVHVNGPAKRGVISNIYGGVMGDDAVSLTPNDFATMTNSAGDIEDVLIDNVFVKDGARRAVLVLAGQSTDLATQYEIRNIRVRNVHGTVDHSLVWIGEDTAEVGTQGGTFDNISVDGVTAYGGAGDGTKSTVYVSGDVMDDIDISGVRPDPLTDAGAVMVYRGSNVDRMRISRITWDTARTGTLYGAVTVYGSVNDLDVTDVSATVSSGWPVVLVQTGQTPPASVKRATLSNIHYAPAAGSGNGSLFRAVESTMTVENLVVSDVVYTAGASDYLATLATTTDVSLSDIQVKSTTQVAWLWARGTGAITVSGATGLSGSGNTVYKEAGATVRSRDHGFRVNLDQLTPTTGDMAYNTNGNLAVGIGPVTYYSGAWHRA